MKIAAAVLGALASAAGLLGFASDRADRRAVALQGMPFLETSLPGASASVGLGTVVSESGHVVTGYHVVRGCRTLRVARSGEPATGATAIAFDTGNDLAVLKTGLVGVLPAKLRVAARGAVMEAVHFVGMEGRPGAIPRNSPCGRRASRRSTARSGTCACSRSSADGRRPIRR